MGDPVACAGAPRDLGLDQGRARADALRARFASLPLRRRLALRAGWLPAEVAALRRDLQRHLPHLWETLAGLAAGARVPPAWLVRELGVPEDAALAGAGGRLARSLAGPTLLRRSRPEGLFASVELTRPWLPAALAGVNERGLAAVAAGTPAPGEGAAPGWLLIQDCLERFERLDAALEWCLRRPAAGRGALLLTDARGEAAGVVFAGAGRRVLRPAGGELAHGDDGGLAKRLAGEAGVDGLAGGVLLDPGGRRLLHEGRGFGP